MATKPKPESKARERATIFIKKIVNDRLDKRCNKFNRIHSKERSTIEGTLKRNQLMRDVLEYLAIDDKKRGDESTLFKICKKIHKAKK